MGIDLVISTPGEITEKERALIEAMLAEYNSWWKEFGFEPGPNWAEREDEDGNLWTACRPGPRFIGVNVWLDMMNLENLPWLVQIWGAFHLTLGRKRPLYVLDDHNIPTHYDKPAGPKHFRKLAKQLLKEKNNG